MIGDSLLTEASGHYSSIFMKKKGKHKSEDQLHIETMYALKCIPTGMYTAEQAKNMPKVLLDVLVEALNSHAKIPHTLIIVMNNHNFWNQSSDLLHFQMERIITKFIKEIRKIVELRNWSLPIKAVNWEYPRIFITKPLPMPNKLEHYPKGFRPNRRRFNKLLLRGEATNRYKSINLAQFMCENENKLFDKKGRATEVGYKEFWIAVSDAVHKSDNNNRITNNKLKAKTLASQITLNQAELHEDNNSTYSDIETCTQPENTIQACKRILPRNKPISKRSLLQDFNNCDQEPCHSPALSTISEYFTSMNPHITIAVLNSIANRSGQGAALHISTMQITITTMTRHITIVAIAIVRTRDTADSHTTTSTNLLRLGVQFAPQ